MTKVTRVRLAFAEMALGIALVNTACGLAPADEGASSSEEEARKKPPRDAGSSADVGTPTASDAGDDAGDDAAALADASAGAGDAGTASGDADEVHFTPIATTAVTFDWRGSATRIRFGTSTAYDRGVDAQTPSVVPFSSAGPFWEAKITGLAADTEYHYAIGAGADSTFRTPPARGATAGFDVYSEGDIGGSNEFSGVLGVQDVVAADLPAFVLMVGDLTYANATSQATVDAHFNDVMAWSQRAAYVPAWGNHEWDDPAHDDLRNYKGRFDLPNAQTSPGAPALGGVGEDWSWFDYGNVRFVAYPEPYTSSSWSDWNAKATSLMDEAQSDPAIAFIVTFGHRPAYSSGYHPGDGTLKSYLDALGAAHSKYKLNVSGHSHDYERSYPQSGVVHLTVGTGGGELEEYSGSCLYAVCPAPSWSAYRALHYGATKLHFGATSIDGTYMCGPSGGGTNDVSCVAGSPVDRFSIPK